MLIANELRPGTTFLYENNIYTSLGIALNKTAMRQMVVKVKSKDLRTGVIKDIVFTGGDKVEQAHIDKSEMQYLYDSGDSLVFMDKSTYEQIEIPRDRLSWELNFLKPDSDITISTFEGEVLGIILPDKVALKVVETEPAVAGNTATSAQKNATLETGWQIKVPLFINQDEVVLVSTIDGKYSGRA